MNSYYQREVNGVTLFSVKKDNGDKWEIAVNVNGHSGSIQAIDSVNGFDDSCEEDFLNAKAQVVEYLNQAV